MDRKNETYNKVRLALNVAVPAVEIVNFMSMLIKSTKQSAGDALRNNKGTRKIPKWAVVLNIVLRVVLIAAYISAYKKDKGKEIVRNYDCQFWDYCDENCADCTYYKTAMKTTDNADKGGCVDCAACDCTDTQHDSSWYSGDV